MKPEYTISNLIMGLQVLQNYASKNIAVYPSGRSGRCICVQDISFDQLSSEHAIELTDNGWIQTGQYLWEF